MRFLLVLFAVVAAIAGCSSAPAASGSPSGAPGGDNAPPPQGTAAQPTGEQPTGEQPTGAQAAGAQPTGAQRSADGAAAPFQTEVESVAAIFARYLAERAKLHPVFATRAGIHDYDHWLTRYDNRHAGKRLDLARATLAELEAAGAAHRPPADLVDWKLLRAQLRVEIAESERLEPRSQRPGFVLEGVGSVNDLLIRDFAPRSVRVFAALSRMRQLLQLCNDMRGALRRPPALWTRMAIEDLGGALDYVEALPELVGEGTPGLREAMRAAKEALGAYRDHLRESVLPRSDGEIAAGREHFDFLLREGHLLGHDADSLLALGREQWELTTADLESTARAIDPGRGWRELLAEMMEQHPSAEGLLDAYRDEVARARAFLVEHALVPIPEEELQILETPAFMRSTVPFAAYDAPAPLDASRLGTFYVTPVPEAHIVSDIPGTTWHEAYPGHHLQLVYAKDNPSLVRALNESPLLSEGWGLYCEELAHETGYYDDPRERLMQLNWKLQRAARVILDVSIHAFGMPYEEAVAFLVERVGMGREQAEASVNAYTQSPTYFSCYLVGMLEIVRVREACRARLGGRFSLGEFHERLLRCGNIPPALVEEELERTWR